MERVYLSSGQTILAHNKEICNPPCALHYPSSHHMITWKLVYRDDLSLLERICPHGVGHPDPDSIQFLKTKNPADSTIETHGCDGCCDATKWEQTI